MSVETDAPRVVTAVITVKVSQGEEGSSTGWLTEMNKPVASFAGYITAVVIPPVSPCRMTGSRSCASILQST